jgi:hypothetical protein
VSVYKGESQPAGQDTVPAGAAVTTGTVAGSSVTFTGLEEGRRYLAYAAGVSKRFLIQPGSVDTLRPITGQEAQALRDRLDELELTGPVALNVMDTLVPYADVKRDGVTNDSAALQARHDVASAAGRAVYYPGGTSAYLAGNLQLEDDAVVFGDWGTSVILMPPSSPVAPELPPDGDLTTNARFIFVNKHGGSVGDSNISIEGLILDGNVANGNSANEFYFGIGLFSVAKARIEKVWCRNLRGDGILIGWNGTINSSDVTIRNIILEDCGQDIGVGAARQGIAITSCQRFTIRDIFATRISGPTTSQGYVVDLEPDTAGAIVEDFTIEGIHGYDCVGGVSMFPSGGAVVRRGYINDVTMRDGPTRSYHSCVGISSADSISIGPALWSDSAPFSGLNVWVNSALPPTNLIVDAHKSYSVTRATSVTPEADAGRVSFTGTAGNVTFMWPTWAGHTVVFYGIDGAVLVDGSNLNLEGDFYFRVGDAITLQCDGTNWNEISRKRNVAKQATVATDATFTVVPGVDSPEILHTGTLTATRTVGLGTTGARRGDTFAIARSGGGAFNLNVGSGLKLLATGQWVVVEFDGTNWYVARFGSL